MEPSARLPLAEAEAWLRFSLVPELGGAAQRRLLAALGSPEEVLGASIGSLEPIVGRRPAEALKRGPEPARVAAALHWLGSDEQPPDHARRHGLPGNVARDRRSASRSVRMRANRAAAASRAGDGGQSQRDTRGCGGCRRLRRGIEQCRPDDRERPRVGYRHGGAPRRARRRILQHRGAGHRTGSRVSGAQPRPRPSLEQGRADDFRVSAGNPGDGAEFSSPQPHHQRTCPRVSGRGSGVAQRVPDHRPAGSRAGTGSVCHPRLHSLAPVQRLSLVDQAGGQAGGVRARTYSKN